eukprot:3353553-Pleurochrysis_carterae.AAC.2
MDMKLINSRLNDAALPVPRLEGGRCGGARARSPTARGAARRPAGSGSARAPRDGCTSREAQRRTLRPTSQTHICGDTLFKLCRCVCEQAAAISGILL